MAITPKDFFSAKASDSLTQLKSGSYSRQDGATELVKETTGTGLEFFFQIGARNFF